jgi:hypothetical protein
VGESRRNGIAGGLLTGALLVAASLAGGGCGAETDAVATDDLHGHTQFRHHHRRHDHAVLEPILECVTGSRHGRIALFGYLNRSPDTVIVPVGPMNHFSPRPEARFQPVRFFTGRQRGAFTAGFLGAATWHLGHKRAVANHRARPCNADERQLVADLEELKRHFAGTYDRADVVHSFDEPLGYSIDCVNITEQPGLRGTGLPLQRHPRVPPPPAPAPPPGSEVLPSTSGGTDQNGAARSCPTDTVSIRRFALEDVRVYGSLAGYVEHQGPPACPSGLSAYSHRTYNSTNTPNHGMATVMSVENPRMDTSLDHTRDHSISQTWLLKPGCLCDEPGCDQTGRQSIESGWRKTPQGNFPVFFIYHTTDNYTDRITNSCYNLECPGFVQTSNRLVLGGMIGETSAPPVAGQPRSVKYIAISWYKDGDDGDWWLTFTHPDGTPEEVGYFRHDIFSSLGLRESGQRVGFGGEVHDDALANPGTPASLTDMGSGANPITGADDDPNSSHPAIQRSLTALKLGTGAFTGVFGGPLSDGRDCFAHAIITAIDEDHPDDPAVILRFGGRCR